MDKEITTNKQLEEALVGRTIVKARMDENVIGGNERIDGSHEPYREWDYHGGDIKLTLDNDVVIYTSSSGYDAWGNEIYVEKPDND